MFGLFATEKPQDQPSMSQRTGSRSALPPREPQSNGRFLPQLGSQRDPILDGESSPPSESGPQMDGPMPPPQDSMEGHHPNPHIPLPKALLSVLDASQWGTIDVGSLFDASQVQINTFLAFLTESYRCENLQGRKLWCTAKEDIGDWPLAFMENVDRRVMRHFRDYLLEHGVWINIEGTSMARNVHDALQRTEFYFWNAQEITVVANRSRIFHRHAQDPDFRADIMESSNVHENMPPSVYRSHPSHHTSPFNPHPPVMMAPQTGSSFYRQNGHTPQYPPFPPQPQPPPIMQPNFTASVPPPPPPPPPRPAPQQGPYHWNAPPEPNAYYPRANDFRRLDVPYPPAMPGNKPSARQLTDLMKLYTDDMKYSGSNYDVLDVKLATFFDTCAKVGIDSNGYGDAFSIMLTGAADKFYRTRFCLPGTTRPDFHAMTAMMKAYFENAQRRQYHLTEWRRISLAAVIAENPDLDKSQALELLINKLINLQQALYGGYAADEQPLTEQLLNACENMEECRFCLYSPAPTFQGVCNQLRASIGTAVRQQQSHQQYVGQPMKSAEGQDMANQYWPDRHYNKQDDVARLDKTRNKNGKKCYVCEKQGCWSTKHTAAERKRAYEKFKANKHVKDSSTNAYEQFLLSYEGTQLYDADDQSNSDEDISQMLQQCTIDENSRADHFVVESLDATTDGMETLSYLATQSTFHAITKEDPYADNHVTGNDAIDHRYSSTTFQGIMPDSGAAEHSTCGHEQLKALQRTIPVTVDTTVAGQVSIRFGDSKPYTSLGKTVVPTPLGDIAFHVMPTRTPFLFSLKDMDSLGVVFDNTCDLLRQGDKTVPIVRKWGHAWMMLHPALTPSTTAAFLSDVELRRLHRRFGHPSVRRLWDVLQRSGTDVEYSAIQELTKICKHCQLQSKAPQRFRFTLRDPEKYTFNYEIIVDIMYLEGKPVMHVIDSTTAFQAARFMENVTARHTWDILRLCWIDVYQGPPDVIVTDAGRNFHAAEFHEAARSMSITVKEVPVEAHNSVGKVERYHADLRRSFTIIRAEAPETSLECALQAAVKAINDTAGPNGIIPTLLVFGTYPRTSTGSQPSPDVVKRANAIRKAMKELQKVNAQRQVADALAARNGPQTTKTVTLLIASLVRVWREDGKWHGPFRLLATDGETCTLELHHGPTNFRSTAVRPFYSDNNQPSPPHGVSSTYTTEEKTSGRSREDVKSSASAFLSGKEKLDWETALELRKTGVITTPGEPFEASSAAEINALIQRGVFEFVRFNPKVHGNVRIFKSRLVNEIKFKDGMPYEKSRLVIQGYNDDGKKDVLTQAPTIQRASQRLIFALAPSLLQQGMCIWLRDITQAYVQSKTPLARTIWAHLPKVIRSEHPAGTIMKVVKPLYGIAEAGTHWWATYSKHHQDKLGMCHSSFDPCLMITDNDSHFGIVGIQTDDTFGLSDIGFSEKEEAQLKLAGFSAKEKKTLGEGEEIAFNGVIVRLQNGNISVRQKGQAKRLEVITNTSSPSEQYVRQRARGAYLASTCQPEASFDLAIAAQSKNPSKDDIKHLNERLQWQIDNLDRGLTFIPLTLASVKLFVFVDAAFANNADLSSQLGFVIVLGNEVRDENMPTQFQLSGNIIHYTSVKCRRITRSALASEIYGMVSGVDYAYALSTTLDQILSRLHYQPAPTVVCTDSLSLYDCLVKLGTTREKRLMIDILSIRQSYENREVQEIRWIDGRDNMADALTKRTPNGTLRHFIDGNKTTIRMKGWIDR